MSSDYLIQKLGHSKRQATPNNCILQKSLMFINDRAHFCFSRLTLQLLQPPLSNSTGYLVVKNLFEFPQNFHQRRQKPSRLVQITLITFPSAARYTEQWLSTHLCGQTKPGLKRLPQQKEMRSIAGKPK